MLILAIAAAGGLFKPPAGRLPRAPAAPSPRVSIQRAPAAPSQTQFFAPAPPPIQTSQTEFFAPPPVSEPPTPEPILFTPPPPAPPERVILQSVQERVPTPIGTVVIQRLVTPEGVPVLGFTQEGRPVTSPTERVYGQDVAMKIAYGKAPTPTGAAVTRTATVTAKSAGTTIYKSPRGL